MRSRNRKCYRAGTVLAAMISIAATAQNRLASEKPAFRASATLVLVPVTVVDRRGAFVNGLSSGAFTLTEDGVQHPIRSFSEEDAPVSMGIVLDLSGSMKAVLGKAKESLRSLMDDANPGDETFLNTVSSRPRPYAGFTRDFGEVLSRIAFEDAGGNTALIDTVWDSLKQLRSGVYTRKALLVISDGMDNHSRRSREELLGLAMESDAQIYTIAVVGGAPYAKPIEMMEAKRGLLFLDELSAKTGGMSFTVQDRADIAKASANIGHALRNLYTIGYVPRDSRPDGRWRRIRVKVAGSGMKAYARAGYRRD